MACRSECKARWATEGWVEPSNLPIYETEDENG